VKDISYYKENAEENYTTTPISVLRYISALEAATKTGFFWDDEAIAYFKSKNKPGCEGDYIRAITDFVCNNFTWQDSETYQELIEDLISKTRR
jgi:hypothetical protein